MAWMRGQLKVYSFLLADLKSYSLKSKSLRKVFGLVTSSQSDINLFAAVLPD